MEFLRSFLRRHFAGKPLVASRNVGCFLRLLRKIVEIQNFFFWGGGGGKGGGGGGMNVSLSLTFFLGTNSSKADQKTSFQLDKDMFVSALGSKTL